MFFCNRGFNPCRSRILRLVVYSKDAHHPLLSAKREESVENIMNMSDLAELAGVVRGLHKNKVPG